MRLTQFINERDIAQLDVEDCKEFEGEDKIDCKIDKYEEYIRDLQRAIRTSDSDDEEDSLKVSLKDAKAELFKLRSKT